MNEFFNQLINEGSALSKLEITAVVTALIYVYLATKGNKWCFLFGLISSSIYLYITFIYKFYFDFGINGYYVVMSVYGWLAWSKKNGIEDEKINRINTKKLLLYIFSGAIITVILASLVTKFTDASLPYFDAFTTVFSIIATFMVVKKELENWLFWIVIDLVASYMYYYKELYFTALLFVIYTFVAVFGYFRWKKIMIQKI